MNFSRNVVFDQHFIGSLRLKHSAVTSGPRCSHQTLPLQGAHCSDPVHAGQLPARSAPRSEFEASSKVELSHPEQIVCVPYT